MSLLILSNQELKDKVLSELAQNPALELVEETMCPQCRRSLRGSSPCPICSLRSTEEGPIVFLSPREAQRRVRNPIPDGQPLDEEPAAPESLTIHVLQQLAGDLEPDERQLAIYILSSLDEDGFLLNPPVYIARATRKPFSQVEHVLQLISRTDPAGLATSGPKEALLTQLDLVPVHGALQEICKSILEAHFAELGRRDYEKIADFLEVSATRVRQAASFIQDNLNPYPGRSFWGSGRQPQQGNAVVYHTPDITISQNPSEESGPLMVEIFAPMMGWLRVNPLFNQAKNDAEDETKEEWSKYLERASLFVKCIQQRNNTLRRMMEILVSQQRAFIVKGDRHLKPMTRAKLAKSLSVHESTVSRAVSHKSVALPDGRIIPLARFFDRSLSVRDRIKEIVKTEDRPLSDDQIASLLQGEGVRIARRTVAKYRAIEGILPARLRHRKTAPTPI
jgi:RNA polymerase sigma-54 factor